MSLLVDDVVGKLEFVERQRSTHPVLSGGWRVRVNVDLPANHWSIGLAGHDPPAVLVLVPTAVDRNDVDHDDVVDVGAEAAHFQLQRREHPPARQRDICCWTIQSGSIMRIKYVQYWGVCYFAFDQKWILTIPQPPMTSVS